MGIEILKKKETESERKLKCELGSIGRRRRRSRRAAQDEEKEEKFTIELNYPSNCVSESFSNYPITYNLFFMMKRSISV